MKKILMIFITISILILCFYTYTFATNSDIDMNLPNNNENTTDTNTNPTSDAETDASNEGADMSSLPQVTGAINEPQNFFTAGNILSILLITVGIVLILLGVAIFIRIK